MTEEIKEKMEKMKEINDCKTKISPNPTDSQNTQLIEKLGICYNTLGDMIGRPEIVLAKKFNLESDVPELTQPSDVPKPTQHSDYGTYNKMNEKQLQTLMEDLSTCFDKLKYTDVILIKDYYDKNESKTIPVVIPKLIILAFLL